SNVRVWLVTIAAFLLVLSLAIPVQAAKKYRFKIQSGYPRGDLSMETLSAFADSAKKRSNGQVIIKVYAAPEIVEGEQLYDAVQRGTLDMAHQAGIFAGGFAPVGNIEFGLPFAFTVDKGDSFQASAQKIRNFYYQSGFVDTLREEYGKNKLHWLDMHSYGYLYIFSSKNVADCNGLNGMKVASWGHQQTFHNKLGMAGTELNPTEIYMALKLGNVDAALYDVSAVPGLHWDEVAPYWLKDIGGDMIFGHILFNQKKWNKLPAKIKAVINYAAYDYWNATVVEYDKMMKNTQSTKLKTVSFNDSCVKKVISTGRGTWADAAGADAASAKSVQMIRDWAN
ncbi:MAG: hypothetical protein GY786_07810, partial [Proteobacteria bacterium]|nr:hypothetical protein [Pseudomonadota bacterium]